MTAADQPPAEMIIVGPEFTDAAIKALLRRKLSVLASSASNATIVEAAAQATAVLAAVWPLVQAMVRDAKVETLDEAITRVMAHPTAGAGFHADRLRALRREVQS